MSAALEGGEWSAARPGRTLPQEKTRYPFLQEAGWAPGPVWTGGKSRPHRDSIPDRLVHSNCTHAKAYYSYVSLILLVFSRSATVAAVKCRAEWPNQSENTSNAYVWKRTEPTHYLVRPDALNRQWMKTSYPINRSGSWPPSEAGCQREFTT